MHPFKSYRTTPERENLFFAERRGFGVWVINAEDGNNAPDVATAPFYFETSNEKGQLLPIVKAHLMKDNTLVQRLRDEPSGVINCTIIVSGPDGYVSPDWYEMSDQVPTWNYVTIHLKGQLRLLPHEDLYGVLDKLSQHFEEAFVEDKPVWKIEKMPPKKLKSMMSVLTPIALQITSVDGTWKLAQAKPQVSREKVATKMLLYSDRKHVAVGMELAALSVLHQTPFTPASAGKEIENMFHSRKITATETTADETSMLSSPISAITSCPDGIFISYEIVIVILIFCLAFFLE